jgi:hypothetical protein
MTEGGLEAGRTALSKLDAVLAARPKKDDHALCEITALACVFRDALIPTAGSGGAEGRERLSHINAVLSVVAGMHYPLSQAPWDELVKARGWLAESLAKASTPAG